MDIIRSRATFRQVKCRWNKKLDSLGLPRIGREVKVLPKTFVQYLVSQNVDRAQYTQPEPVSIAQQSQTIAQTEGAPSNIEGSQFMEMMNKNLEFFALQQAQGQIIINKLTMIEQRLDALELLTKTRNVDFDEQFEEIKKNLATLAPPSQVDQPEQQARLTPAEVRRVEPPQATDHRRDTLPDWVIQDLSYDFEVDAIKNMFERFKQYYYENDRVMPDYNGVKIKLRAWLERAAENGEQVMSARALAELERQRQQQMRAENTRRHEAHERHRAEVQTPEARQLVSAGIDEILNGLVKRNE